MFKFDILRPSRLFKPNTNSYFENIPVLIRLDKRRRHGTIFLRPGIPFLILFRIILFTLFEVLEHNIYIVENSSSSFVYFTHIKAFVSRFGNCCKSKMNQPPPMNDIRYI